MKKSISIILILGTIYLVLIYLKRNLMVTGWLNNHFTDLLCIPLILTSTLAIIRYLKNNMNLILSIPMILFSCIYYSLIFEWILPKYSVHFTNDFYDVFHYFLGGAMYYFIQEILLTKKSNQYG